MPLTRYLLAAFFALLPLRSNADSWHELLRYTCSSQSGQVQVEYVGAYNEAGERLLKGKTQNDVNPWDLIVANKGEESRYIERTTAVVKRCALKHATYSIELGPEPCNRDVQGENGAMMRAYAIVRQGRVVLSREVFGGCTINAALVTTKVQVQVGHRRPIITRKPATEYFMTPNPSYMDSPTSSRN